MQTEELKLRAVCICGKRNADREDPPRRLYVEFESSSQLDDPDDARIGDDTEIILNGEPANQAGLIAWAMNAGEAKVVVTRADFDFRGRISRIEFFG